MVAKPDDLTLTNYGIDSYERAILFCGLTLKAQTVADNFGVNKVKFEFNIDYNSTPPKAIIFFDISLPFNQEPALKGGGEFPKNTNFVTLGDGLPVLLTDEPITPWGYSEYPLPVTPSWCDTIEEYLYWLATDYQKKLIADENPNFSLINISINSSNQETRIQVNIPISFSEWLVFHNFYLAAQPIWLWSVTSGVTWIDISAIRGLSAYQIWIAQGNVGTEADFLASLKGADGIIGADGQSAYQIWIAQGNVGTEADFLASLKGVDGIIGVDGQSAYQIWIAQGNVGTEADFLASLKGLKGDPGPVSVSVDPSPITLAAGQSVAIENVGTASDLILKFSIPQGLTGDTGLSAYQIWLAQGNSGTVSDFLASIKGETGAIGPQGLTGDTGLSAYQIWLAQGNSGTVSDFLASLKGIKGDTGAAGSVNAASFLGLNYQISDPSPVTDQILIYAKSDGKLYQLPPTGFPSLIGSGATGSGASVNDIWLYGGI